MNTNLKGKTLPVIFFVLLLASMSIMAFHTQIAKSIVRYITVPDDYSTIQEAINNANERDTIFVRSGTYYEHVSVSKSIKLVGESRDTVIVDGNAANTVIWIASVNVTISNITVRNAYSGIVGWSSSSITISHNSVYDCSLMGIHLDGRSTQCRIIDNIVANCLEGIELERSAENFVEQNSLLNNNVSIVLNRCGTLNVFRGNNMNGGYSLIVQGSDLAGFIQDIDDSNVVNNKTLYYLVNRENLLINPSNYANVGYLTIVNCTKVTVKDLNLTSNRDGIILAYSSNCTLINTTLGENRGPLAYGGLTFYNANNNTIIDSRISNNSCAICLYHSDGNIFRHNSFLNNSRQVVSDFLSPFSNVSSGYFSVNVWDSGYPSGGNHWSDYAGVDLYRGPYQNITGSDGIGDISCVIDADNQDRYPLVDPWVPIQGDIDSSGTVDTNDIMMWANAFGSQPNDPNWNPQTDLRPDNLIDIFDGIFIAVNFGKAFIT